MTLTAKIERGSRGGVDACVAKRPGPSVRLVELSLPDACARVVTVVIVFEKERRGVVGTI